VSRNNVIDNGRSLSRDGITIDANSTAILLARNVANRNGRDGIGVYNADPTTLLRRNSANDNVNTRIFAPGTADGGGNLATGNGIAQCVGISCPA
jgi:hypothetical protein